MKSRTMDLLLIIGVLSGAPRIYPAVYYVATGGSDGAAGTQAAPLKTVAAAVAKVNSGDTVFVRAGTYPSSSTITISISGTSAKKCCLMVFPGDQRPVLDFSSMSAGSSNRGIALKGNYWYIKGLIVKGAGDNGMNISGSCDTIEFCDFLENQDSGLQLGGGAANNQIINCDSYYNMDPGQGNADGFSPKLDVGTGNYFKGCRSWQNSDDGFDGYLRPSDNITTTYENCWCYKNGYLKDGSASTGNGNGFKMGGSDDKTLQHNCIVKNCLAAGNRVKGFDQNNNKGSMTIYNGTAFNNGTNYKIDGTILASGKTLTMVNCISAGTGGVSLIGGTITTCSWSSGYAVSNADFISVDPGSLTSTRKADGSLPTITFMHLAAGSKLIDAGTVISGMPYNGLKPDLGCFETGTTGAATISSVKSPSSFVIFPVNSQGKVKMVFSLLNPVKGTVALFDCSGRMVADLGTVLFARGTNEQWLDMSGLGAGTYFCSVRNPEFRGFQKITRR
jgi:hypothetical protein